MKTMVLSFQDDYEIVFLPKTKILKNSLWLWTPFQLQRSRWRAGPNYLNLVMPTCV